MAYQMDLNVGMKCIKYMLFIANFMFVMVGFLLISIGTTIDTIYSDFEIFMENRFFSPAALCIAIGIIMFIVSVFGCVGAIKESTCLVNTYAFFLSIVFLLEISASIAAYAMRKDLKITLRRNMDDSLNVYNSSHYDKAGWDYMQQVFGCCGIEEPRDWNRSITNYTMPESCYNCEKDGSYNKRTLFNDGCLNKLYYVVSECALLLGVGALCVSFIQILGIVFANMLAKSIRRLKTEIIVEREENRRRIYQGWQESNEKVSPVIPQESDA